MQRLIESKRVFLVGGPGGVGKTTIAATLGIACARAGYRTIVLTVDPAKRLAQALGFEGFKKDIQEVALAGAKGELSATMLDTQRYFDKVIDRFATKPSQKEKILGNPIYRVMVDSLGGTHEYAAMERLLEFASDSRWQRVVVDTPPTHNAIDLLSAPQRLADFMDNSVLRWFQGSKPLYLRVFQKGTKVAMKVIQRIFGAEFLETFGKLVDDFEGMQAGFRGRNLEVIRLLQSAESAFLLVTYPSEARYLECVSLKKSLEEQRIELSGLVLNRVEPVVPAADASGELKAMLDYYRSLRAQHEHWCGELTRLFAGTPSWTVPRRAGALHDVESLSRLGELLVRGA